MVPIKAMSVFGFDNKGKRQRASRESRPYPYLPTALLNRSSHA
uniref:Uncharacterized protein n=1 Tax=Nelumbo nucifera TaxID=4432 RepID=A0A822Y466_NELNU|nr:TPA_asm: hypothetical protein HUJ06_028695 [Nelumbo nucifera]